jgi:hypothetical protein
MKLAKTGFLVATAFVVSCMTAVTQAADCAHGNALDCYNQAQIRLQAAEDALVAARTDIQSLQDKISTLQRESSQVGDIVSSMLADNEFQTQRVSTEWVLADGRSVVGSLYAKVTGNTNIPDLRGVFLRGKNNLMPDESAGRNPAGDLPLGQYQPDALAAHQHDFKYGFKQDDAAILDRIQGGSNTPYTVGSDSGEKTEIQPNASEETRPRNVTANYFIKIN